MITCSTKSSQIFAPSEHSIFSTECSDAYGSTRQELVLTKDTMNLSLNSIAARNVGRRCILRTPTV